METKVCNKCGKEKPLTEFYFRKDTNNYRKVCKKCVLENNKKNDLKYRENNKEKIREKKRNYYLSKKNDNGREKLLKLRYNKYLFNIRKRICYKCNEEKNIEDFRKDKSQKTGYGFLCKECCSKYAKQYSVDNADKIKEKKRIPNNSQKRKEYMKVYNRNYFLKNKEEINFRKNKYDIQKRKNNSLERLKSNTRNMLNKVFKVKGYKKNTKSFNIIGLHWDEFYIYLLQTFKDNYGYDWDGVEPVHIDHIIPISTATTEEEIIKLCHHTNLQLLKAKDNLKKSNKLDWEISNE